MKRYARLSLGFSKKFENLETAVNLHVAYFNFCWLLLASGRDADYHGDGGGNHSPALVVQ